MYPPGPQGRPQGASAGLSGLQRGHSGIAAVQGSQGMNSTLQRQKDMCNSVDRSERSSYSKQVALNDCPGHGQGVWDISVPLCLSELTCWPPLLCC